MTSFFEELWTSVFTPGPTPTLLVATNATFAALQSLLLILLIATYSIHFLVLSILSAGLWYSINWFARELIAAEAAKQGAGEEGKRDRSPELGSETETEDAPQTTRAAQDHNQQAQQSLQPPPTDMEATLRKRKSPGDTSGYVSTDSEWEKVSEGG